MVALIKARFTTNCCILRYIDSKARPVPIGFNRSALKLINQPYCTTVTPENVHSQLKLFNCIGIKTRSHGLLDPPSNCWILNSNCMYGDWHLFFTRIKLPHVIMWNFRLDKSDRMRSDNLFLQFIYNVYSVVLPNLPQHTVWLISADSTTACMSDSNFGCTI